MTDTLFFGDADAFSEWLEAHHMHTPEVWVLFHKKGSGKTTQTWPEAVDVALCFGWIDGLRQSVDSDSYRVRFTPRKRNSVWSSVSLHGNEWAPAEGECRFIPDDGPARSRIYLTPSCRLCMPYRFRSDRVKMLRPADPGQQRVHQSSMDRFSANDDSTLESRRHEGEIRISS